MFFNVELLALLSKVVNMEPKSPPMSIPFPPSSFGGVAVLAVEAVMPLDRLYSSSYWIVGTGGTSEGLLSCGGGTLPFFWTPKEKVRPARFKNPEPLGLWGGREASGTAFLPAPRSSCAFGPPMSADDGAVEALLCREELSVDVAFVVWDAPLSLTVG